VRINRLEQVGTWGRGIVNPMWGREATGVRKPLEKRTIQTRDLWSREGRNNSGRKKWLSATGPSLCPLKSQGHPVGQPGGERGRRLTRFAAWTVQSEGGATKKWRSLIVGGFPRKQRKKVPAAGFGGLKPGVLVLRPNVSFRCFSRNQLWTRKARLQKRNSKNNHLDKSELEDRTVSGWAF